MTLAERLREACDDDTGGWVGRVVALCAEAATALDLAGELADVCVGITTGRNPAADIQKMRYAEVRLRVALGISGPANDQEKQPGEPRG